MIHVYTGDGQGKTSAALGLALRSLGRGKKVALIRFLKNRPSGELTALARFDNCRVSSFGKAEFILGRSPDKEDRREAEAGMAEAERILGERSADLLILDEINPVLDLRLLPPERIEQLISRCPEEIDLVLTGRNCPTTILSRADYASDIREIRHPWKKGAPARPGIEY